MIAKGNTADVFEIGDNKVVKLFKTGYPLDSVRHEFENSKLLHTLDIPIAKSYELVTYEGRHGIVYDRIDGESMLDILLQTEDVKKQATALALLHKRILAHQLPSAFSLKSILKSNIERANQLGAQWKAKLITVLDELPGGNCFCHGDFHFGNVIVNRKEYYIIDYMNICHGPEYGDIARTVYLLEMTPANAENPGVVANILNMKKRVTDIYLEEMGVSRESLSDWLMVTAAARLSELNSAQKDETNAILDYLMVCGL